MIFISYLVRPRMREVVPAVRRTVLLLGRSYGWFTHWRLFVRQIWKKDCFLHRGCYNCYRHLGHGISQVLCCIYSWKIV